MVHSSVEHLNSKREAIDNFIKTCGEFDGVIDFASVVTDPADPTSLAPELQ